MGTLRGKVGDLVFTRLKGKQVMKARNRQPQNNRTVIQQTHRAKIAACMRFFSMAQQNLFKFAFSDQKKNETDMNAFIRHNYSQIVPQTKRGLDFGCPVMSDVKLTSGTLRGVPLKFSNEGNFNYPRLSFTTDIGQYPADLTCRDVSLALIRDYGLEDGDILTLVTVDLDATDCNPQLNWQTFGMTWNNWDAPRWRVAQFRLDTSSIRSISDYGTFFFGAKTPTPDSFEAVCPDNELELGNRSVRYTPLDTGAVTQYAWVTLILSRVSGKKTEVSTNYLMPNAKALYLTNPWVRDTWPVIVGETWNLPEVSDITPGTILQGSDSFFPTVGYVDFEVFRDADCQYRPVYGRNYETLYVKVGKLFTVTKDMTTGSGYDTVQTYLDSSKPEGRQATIKMYGNWRTNINLPDTVQPGVYPLRAIQSSTIFLAFPGKVVSFNIPSDR